MATTGTFTFTVPLPFAWIFLPPGQNPVQVDPDAGDGKSRGHNYRNPVLRPAIEVVSRLVRAAQEHALYAREVDVRVRLPNSVELHRLVSAWLSRATVVLVRTDRASLAVSDGRHRLWSAQVQGVDLPIPVMMESLWYANQAEWFGTDELDTHLARWTRMPADLQAANRGHAPAVEELRHRWSELAPSIACTGDALAGQ